MNDVQKATLVQARIARALIKMEAMKAENRQREIAGKCLAYTEEAFFQLIESEGIGENAVILTLQD